MKSLKESLQRIGEMNASTSTLKIPSDFHSVPSSSLRHMMRAMSSPRLNTWSPADETEFSNEVWTEECQGLTSIGQSWYIASNNDGRRAIYRFAFGSWDELGWISLPNGIGDHIGGLTSHKGIIYVPTHGPTGPKVWILDADLVTLGVGDLSDKPGVKDDGDISGWCAVNPWNGFYYTSGGHKRTRVHAYDPNDGFSYQGYLALKRPKINGIQGGYFSSTGRLYINSDAYSASNHDPPLTGTKDVRAYSALNGHYFGSCPVPYDEDYPAEEEMEGFTFLKRHGPDGQTTDLHVVILDNDWPDRDDVRIVHFAVPDPSLI